MRRTRGETGPRRLAAAARRCAGVEEAEAPELVFLLPAFVCEAELAAADLADLAAGVFGLGVEDLCAGSACREACLRGDAGASDGGVEGIAGDACPAEVCAAGDCNAIARLSECDPPTHTTPTAITQQNLRPNRTTLLFAARGAAPRDLVEIILPFEVRTHDRNVVFGQAAN